MDTKKFHDNFCENIFHLRKKHNLTQKEMAAIMGVSVGKLRRVEKHDHSTKVNDIMLVRICNHFNVSADEMLYENMFENLRKKF